MLYDLLVRIQPSPVAQLNRAVALKYVVGDVAALNEVESLAVALSGYHLWHAVRADLLLAQGRADEAHAAEQRALELTHNPAERALMRQRLRC